MIKILLSLLTITTLTHSVRLNILNNYSSGIIYRGYGDPLFVGKIASIKPGNVTIKKDWREHLAPWHKPKPTDDTVKIVSWNFNTIVVDIEPNMPFRIGALKRNNVIIEYPYEFTIESETDSDKEYFICAAVFFGAIGMNIFQKTRYPRS